jgi:GntR family transcriptional regulator
MAVPMWRQIADDLRQKIESGELGKDGEPLPTELELQDLYSASRNTVRDAVKSLVTRGLVYTRSGQGTFVAQKIVPFVTVFGEAPDSGMEESTVFKVAVSDRHRVPDVSTPRVEIQQATGIAAEQLGLELGASVVSRHQQRRIDTVPYSLQTTFYPMEFVEGGALRLIQAADITEGAVHYLEGLFGFKEAGRRDTFTVRAPDATEETFFGLSDDRLVSVIELVRTGFDESGRPFRVTVTTLPADRNQLVMETGRVPAESTPAEPQEAQSRAPG